MDVKGMSLEMKFTVTENHTAKTVGSGTLEVLSTPILSAWLENVSMNLVTSKLEEGTTTVGTFISIEHMAATPIGMNVVVKAQVTEWEGRKITIELEASDETEVIAKGKHIRFVVKTDKFLKKALSKI